MAFRSLSSRCFARLAALHLVLYGALLAWSGGVPYVFDNNESFSILHTLRTCISFRCPTAWGSRMSPLAQTQKPTLLSVPIKGTFRERLRL